MKRREDMPTGPRNRGKNLTDPLLVRQKVEQDIAFLTDRIALMKRQARPNNTVIETYEAMLSARIAVLKWLQHGDTQPVSPTSHSA